MKASGDPASSPSRVRASRTSLTGGLRRGVAAWRDAIKRRDVAITLLLIVLSACGGVLYATRDRERFELDVDAACVYVNASTRFTDGAEFGMGAEIGNSTQKLHARGPIGVRELCTFKYVVEGDGHVRS